MMIIKFADKGNLRNVLSKNFNNIMWKNKIELLYHSLIDLKELHKLGYFHKDFHSGNILQIEYNVDSYDSYISDFGLSGPANEQKSDDKVYGVMPYIAPEVLNGEPYTSSADIYSVGVIMAELSSGKPPFYNKKHDLNLAFDICNGLRPEFGKGAPEFFKKLAYKCMNANSNERPKANELYRVLNFWNDILYNGKILGYEEKIQDIFNKKIPNISTLYEKNPDAIYISREFTFSNLITPVNSPAVISHYLRGNTNDKGICSFIHPKSLTLLYDYSILNY
jgi:serine/threonine protein kinase